MESNHITSIFVILLVTTIRSGMGFIAYDDGSSNMNMSVLSLNRIQECRIPIPNPVFIKTKIQLLQVTDFSEVHVIQCKVEIRRSIYHCGMHSHISIVSNGDIEYIEDVSHDACKRAHKTYTYQTYKELYKQIKLNTSTARPITLAGKIDNEGNCRGEAFSDYYGSWDNLVAHGQIVGLLQDSSANVNLQKDKIILRPVVRCTYSAGRCIDNEGGNTYWKVI